MSDTTKKMLPVRTAKPLLQRLPGLGFVYLCVAVCSFGLYIYWIYLPGWYNGALRNAEEAAKHAGYIEKIVADFPADQQKALRQQQLRLYQQIGDSSAAGRILSNLDSDARRQGELLMLLTASKPIGMDQAAKIESLLAEEMAANAVSTWMDLLADAAVGYVSTRPNVDRSTELLEQLLTPNNPIPGSTPVSYRLFGVEPDQWILSDGPGYLLVKRPQNSRLTLTLGVYASAADFPIAVKVSHGDAVVEKVLTSADNVQVELDIAANQTDIVGITTDKFWSLQSDTREFSVRIVNVEFK